MRTLIASLLVVVLSHVARAENWPQFRGPDGQGHATTTNLPTSWSETENVTWKVPLPGEGWSSPVVWGEQIWLTTALEGGKSLRALCVDRTSGKLVHNVEVFKIDEPESVNAKNSYASPTPVIEEGRVYVHFGTNGTACLSTETGSILWTNQTLKLEHKEGPGSSPILYNGYLIVNCDGLDVQYVVALDKHTGKIVWKTPRTGEIHSNPDFRKAYSTPLIVHASGHDELVSTGAQQVMGYDPDTGAELWKVRYTGFSNVARPVIGDGLVYVVTDFARPQLWAIQPGGHGDVTEKRVRWKLAKQAGASPSPLLVEGSLYLVTNRGVASCVDAASGDILWTQRLGGDYSASPLAADGRIYIGCENGTTFVIAPGKEYKLLAENQLDGRIMASPAAVDHAIFLRSDTHLYRIEKRQKP